MAKGKKMLRGLEVKFKFLNFTQRPELNALVIYTYNIQYMIDCLMDLCHALEHERQVWIKRLVFASQKAGKTQPEMVKVMR